MCSYRCSKILKPGQPVGAANKCVQMAKVT